MITNLLLGRLIQMGPEGSPPPANDKDHQDNRDDDAGNLEKFPNKWRNWKSIEVEKLKREDVKRETSKFVQDASAK